MATPSSILAWEIPCSLEGYSPWGHKESSMTEQLSLSFSSWGKNYILNQHQNISYGWPSQGCLHREKNCFYPSGTLQSTLGLYRKQGGRVVSSPLSAAVLSSRSFIITSSQFNKYLPGRPLWAGHCINVDGPDERCSRELELVCAAALALEAVRKPATGRRGGDHPHHSPRSTAVSPALNGRMITIPPTGAFLTTSFSKDKVRISLIKINNLAWIFESPLKNTCDFIS